MMSMPRRFAPFALFLGAGWLVAAGCSTDTPPSGTAATGGTSGNGSGAAGGKSGGPTVVDPGGTGSGGGDGRLNPLCGIVEALVCLPDNPLACRGYEPPGQAGAGGAGDGGAAMGSGGAAGEAGAPGAGGAPMGFAGADAGGAPSTGGEAGESGEAGAGGDGGQGQAPPPLLAFGCQVSRQNNQPVRSCVPAGVGGANAPCFTAADCAPGLACVTEGEAGRCLHYCCDAMTTCEAGSYCAERPLRRSPTDNSEAESPRVPVCAPADGCSLEDRYPCPSGAACRCQGETACMVVRDDGTTTCLEPGSGKEGEPCPCAWNHVCSKLTNQCLKICRTDSESSECGEQKCQASSELPDNFGVCVGPR